MNTKTSWFTSDKWSWLIVLVGDLVALLLFVLVGQQDHGTMNSAAPLRGVLAGSWEFVLLWLAAGWPLGAFPPVSQWRARTLLAPPFLTWLVVAPLSLLLRALVLERLNIPTLFLAATLGFGLLFLWAWRALLLVSWKLRGTTHL